MAALLALVFTGVGMVIVPILTHVDQGDANQVLPDEEWPLEATATGDDGRERRIQIVAVEPGTTVDTSALAPGDRFVVSGTGYDPARGIYVAICAIPDDPSQKPGPCLGGVPDQEAVEVAEGTIQFAPSNWINDDWAWRLFGARSYDDRDTGTFTAYIEVPPTADENVDCSEVACALYTRNDHTAANDRVQDVYIPLGFVG
ncbi:hypothetical protein GCM10011600_24430 [Pseudolysinimonas yzui]|uniref:Uncharacterized protein n=1 Tax=Pseudolysinimonas yzui TaxID=2708254 RepID=A0A8J3GSK8_9MICO|nr:hypothetical protein GCM10011600_24430 [Pseudolysinimonas yzui]